MFGQSVCFDWVSQEHNRDTGHWSTEQPNGSGLLSHTNTNTMHWNIFRWVLTVCLNGSLEINSHLVHPKIMWAAFQERPLLCDAKMDDVFTNGIPGRVSHLNRFPPDPHYPAHWCLRRAQINKEEVSDRVWRPVTRVISPQLYFHPDTNFFHAI